MKRLFLLAALSCVAAFGINTATASAGNCNVGMSGMQYSNPSLDPPPWGPYVAFNFVNCTGVSGVEVAEHITGSTDHGGWFDATLGLYPGVNLCSNGRLNANECNTKNNYQVNVSAGTYVAVFYRPVYAGTTHWVNRSAFYRIKSGTTWGPWHFFWDSAGQAAFV